MVFLLQLLNCLFIVVDICAILVDICAILNVIVKANTDNYNQFFQPSEQCRLDLWFIILALVTLGVSRILSLNLTSKTASTTCDFRVSYRPTNFLGEDTYNNVSQVRDWCFPITNSSTAKDLTFPASASPPFKQPKTSTTDPPVQPERM